MLCTINKFILGFISVLLSSLYVNAAQIDNQIIQAMRDELKRSMNELHLKGLEKPYYIEYILNISSEYSISSQLGAVCYKSVEGNKVALLTTNVRVGDYKFDNTGFNDISYMFFGSTTDDDNEVYIDRRIPAEFDYNMLRRELWLATDAAYKVAAEELTKKKVTLDGKIIRDTTWNFSKANPVVTIDTNSFEAFDAEKYTKLTKDISKIFASHSDIISSNVEINYIPKIIYYVNSEGIEYIKNEGYVTFNIVGYTQREDGIPIVNAHSCTANKLSELPTTDSLTVITNRIISNIEANMKASILEDSYVGPVLFEEPAAAELLISYFANNLSAVPKNVLSSGWSTSDNSGLAFQNKIGSRVLPTFISIEDKPSQSKYKNINLLGHYKIDDDGIAARDVELVKDGYLKTLLSTRIPVKKINESNGHKRYNQTIYSNLFVNSNKSQQLTNKELKKQLLKLCKDRELPYGIIVKNIISSNLLENSIRSLIPRIDFVRNDKGNLLSFDIYKIYQDGHEELVVGGDLSGFNAASFKDIIKTGKDIYIYNTLLFKYATLFSGSLTLPVSIITPSLLLEEGELKVSEADYPKLHYIKSPLAD